MGEVKPMWVPATGAKVVVHSTSPLPPPQCEHPQQRSAFVERCKPAFNQTFSRPRQQSPCSQWRFAETPPTSTFDKKFSGKRQNLTVKSDHSDSQLEGTNNKSDSPAMIALNIPVTNDDETTEVNIRNCECKKLEDLMANLSVSGKESKTKETGFGEVLKITKKGNDCSKNTELLYDSFQKLTISARKNKIPAQRSEKEHNEEGELIERGPVSSSKKLQLPTTHPYRQQASALTLSARYSLKSGGMVAEPYINSYESQLSEIPQTVEELYNSATLNVTKETEEIITSEILNEEDFKSFVRDWLSKQIEQGDNSITDNSATNLQPSVFSETLLGNTSPHCSGDSAYSTMSPDSNVVSPLSYMSPMSSPFYNGNDFTHETLLNEIVTSNSSSSDSNHLPSEPIEPLDLFDLIDDYLSNKSDRQLQQNNSCDDIVGPDKHNIRNQTQQNCQFYAGPSQTNSIAPRILQVINDKVTQELPHNNSVAPPIVQVVNQKIPSQISSVQPHVQQAVNNKSPSEVRSTNTLFPHANARLPSTRTDQPLTVGYNVTRNQFNFALPNVVTKPTPQKYVLKNLTPVNHVQANIINHQTVYIPAKASNQIPLNIPLASASPPFTHRHNLLPVTEAKVHTSKPDNSVNSFICGENSKKNISKSVPLNPTTRFIAPASSVRPAERHILPAGTEVYEAGMSVPAAVRLKSLMKNMDFTVQYVKVCHELANRPGLLKERLFQLLTETPRAQNWLMRIYAHIALTVSMESKLNVLTTRNSEGRSLLYLACVNHPDEPVIARYIADNLVDISRTSNVEVNPDEVYDGNGNSLMHLLASLGDSHVFVLAELLNIRHPKTKEPVFNVNRPNISQMETPLHVAVSKHSLPYVNCLSTVKVLITHGAEVTAQDKRGMTPLHCAVQGNCELKILTLLLQSRTSHAALDITDNEHNSVMHLAAANNGISLLKQRAIISSLIGHGADYRIPNVNGKVPLVLVDVERRQEIKKLFPKK